MASIWPIINWVFGCVGLVVNIEFARAQTEACKDNTNIRSEWYTYLFALNGALVFGQCGVFFYFIITLGWQAALKVRPN